MRDPLNLAADAAALLGLAPKASSAPPSYELTPDEMLKLADDAELNAFLRSCKAVIAWERRTGRRHPRNRGVPAGRVGALVPLHVQRRMVLRRELGVGRREVEGQPASPRRCAARVEVRGCRCGEWAAAEVAVRVLSVDEGAVVEVRRLAGVLHARFARRVERARKRLRPSAPALSGVAVPRRDVGRIVDVAGVEAERRVVVSPPPFEHREAPVRAGRSTVTAAGRRIDAAGDLNALSLRLTGRRLEKAPPRGVEVR